MENDKIKILYISRNPWIYCASPVDCDMYCADLRLSHKGDYYFISASQPKNLINLLLDRHGLFSDKSL